MVDKLFLSIPVIAICASRPHSGTVGWVIDVNKGWPDEWKGSFDFVHQRLVVANAGRHQKEAIQGLAGLVKPGGWIQLVEVDVSNPLADSCGPLIHDFFGIIKSSFAFTGVDAATANKTGGWLEEVGFVDIQERVISMRLGAANPDADLARRGVSAIVTAANSLAAFGKTLPLGTMSLSPERLDTFGSNVREELITRGAKFPLRAVWARRPS